MLEVKPTGQRAGRTRPPEVA